MTQPVLQDYFAGFALTDEERYIRSPENLILIKTTVEQLIRKKFPQLKNFSVDIAEVEKSMRVVIGATRIQNPQTSRLKVLYPPRINAMITQKVYTNYLLDLYTQDGLDEIPQYKIEEHKNSYAIPVHLYSRPSILASPNTAWLGARGI